MPVENPAKMAEIAINEPVFDFTGVIYSAKKAPARSPRAACDMERRTPRMEVREPMAVKKSKPEAAASPKDEPKTTTTPKAKKAAAPTPAPAVAIDTASKAATPKPAPAAAKAPAAKKAAAPVKLTDRQLDFLKQIQGKGEGYVLEKKAEQRTIDALLDRKLIKKGAKDKTSGHFRYMVSKAGEKHLQALPPA